MKQNEKYISGLIDRFFSGETTLSEERALYSFFADHEIPESLRAYIPVFGFFSTGIRSDMQPAAPVDRRKKARQYLWRGAVSAACLAAFAVLLIFSESPDPFEDGCVVIHCSPAAADPETVGQQTAWLIREAIRQELELDTLAAEADLTERLLQKNSIK